VIWDIVHAQPGYEINVRNAVVHEQPSGLVSDGKNFLKLTILRFDVHDQVAEAGSKRLFGLVKQRFGIPEKASGPSVRGELGSAKALRWAIHKYHHLDERYHRRCSRQSNPGLAI
jgi:hypothetical protein